MSQVARLRHFDKDSGGSERRDLDRFLERRAEALNEDCDRVPPVPRLGDDAARRRISEEGSVALVGLGDDD